MARPPERPPAWHLRWTADADEALSAFHRKNPRNAARIVNDLDRFAKRWSAAPPGERPNMVQRFGFKKLSGAAGKAGIHQISVGMDNRGYRAALLLIDEQHRIWVLHLFSKGEQEAGIARAIAIAARLQE